MITSIIRSVIRFRVAVWLLVAAGVIVSAYAAGTTVHLPGLETPVSPGSTVGGCMVVNALKAEVAARMVAAGAPPRVLTAACLVGRERSSELFEAAYDEHARRLARLYANLGSDV